LATVAALGGLGPRSRYGFAVLSAALEVLHPRGYGVPLLERTQRTTKMSKTAPNVATRIAPMSPRT
jgi:hypothetical protein